MTEDQLNQIKDIVSDFFTHAKITRCEVRRVERIGSEHLNVAIFAEDASACIGEGGQNIAAFEALLRLMIKKQIAQAPLLRLDINNYRSSKDEALRELAKKAARRARFYKQPVALEAMSAYNRRIIHTELAAHPDIKTESAGFGSQRRVVVKYIE